MSYIIMDISLLPQSYRLKTSSVNVRHGYTQVYKDVMV
jgi:hypothetical protein